MITLMVHSESSHQAELCPLDVLRLPWKHYSGQVEEAWRGPCVNGAAVNKVCLEMEIAVGWSGATYLCG